MYFTLKGTITEKYILRFEDMFAAAEYTMNKIIFTNYVFFPFFTFCPQ